MDIHRCRFVPYNPQAINALAFSHPPSAELQGRGIPTLRLAIGRANGDIDIWNPLRGAWFQETILRGGKDRSIEGLAWTLDPSEQILDTEVPGKLRLFSIGYSSVVTEWDLEQGRPARHSSGNYGEIWCLAAQPRWRPTRKGKDGKLLPAAEGEYTGQHLAAGCADGTIVILSTEDGDLKWIKTMRPSTKRARVLSIAFQNRHTVVAGYADSSMRIFDIRSGKLLRTVSLGKGQTKDTKELLVWSVKCLPDGTIVSGDSAGEIRFWDGKNYSLVQRIQSHEADVLDIAVSGDGQSVISGGADQRTTVYKLKGREKGVKTQRWAEIMHRRYHTHDVKALAVYETRDISIVVSGGLDTIPVVVPLREYGKEHHRKLPNLPQIPPVSSSPNSRLLMGWWDREVNIWRVSGSPAADTEPFVSEQHKLVGKVLFQGEENLSSAALSQDGKLIVAATISEVKMFSLRRRKGEQDGFSLRVHKIALPSEISSYGAKRVHISPDCQWLCLVRPDNQIYVAKIMPDPEAQDGRLLSKIQRLRRANRHARPEKTLHGTLGSYDRTIRCIDFSGDSRIVACGDLLGCVDTWVLQDDNTEGDNSMEDVESTSSDEDSSSDEEDSEKLVRKRPWTWTRPAAETPIPRLNSAILHISFRPATIAAPHLQLTDGTSRNSSPSIATHHSSNPTINDDRLMVLTAEHHLSEFHVLKAKFSDWSRRNPKAFLPAEFTMIKDRAMGTLWDTRNGRDRLWLYGPSWLWMFDLSQDFPPPSGEGEVVTQETPTKELTKKNKRKRKIDNSEDEESGNKKKPNTGAGDQMALSEATTSLGRKMRKIVGDNAAEGQWIELDTQRKLTGGEAEAEDEDESDGPSESHLAILRRESYKADADTSDNRISSDLLNGMDLPPSSFKDNTTFAVVINNHKNQAKAHSDNQVAKLSTPDPDMEPEAEKSSQNKRWWYTFKYREILGIASLSQETDYHPTEGEADAAPLEVAVVERPIWDVNLPGRYIRDYE